MFSFGWFWLPLDSFSGPVQSIFLFVYYTEPGSILTAIAGLDVKKGIPMTQPNMSAEDLDKLEEVSEAYKKYPRSTATFCKYIAPKLDDLIALAREHQQRSQAVEVYQKVGK